MNNIPKVKKLQKLLSSSTLIINDDIKQNSIQMISNGIKTKVDLVSRENNNIRKKAIRFENNKTNLAKLLKVKPVFEDLDSRLYNNFLLIKHQKSKSKPKTKKKPRKTQEKLKKKTKKNPKKKTKKNRLH